MIRRYYENEINDLADILKNDGVISAPTDTVYGICASVNSEKAYNKLINIKKRPRNKLFPVMCADEKQIKEIAIVNKNAEKLIRAFMPGPITLVLKSNNNLPKYVINEKNTIAIRMAPAEILKKLIIKTESPLFMTSANISGEPVCTNLIDIEKKCPSLDGMLEGSTIMGKASTIVDCSMEEIKILRDGPISKEEIIKIVNMK